MIQEDRADEEAPCEHLHSIRPELRVRVLEPNTEEECSHSQEDWWNEIVLLKEAKFRELKQILDEFKSRLNELRA